MTAAASDKPTVRDALIEGTAALASRAPSDRVRLDAEAILADSLGRRRSWLFAHPEAALTDVEGQRYRVLLGRRAAGEPLEYLLGHGDFYGLSLALTPAVLVPRPETETLVEAALKVLRGSDRPLVADVGTGSGAIALAIATQHPGAHVVATDVSMAALAVAAGNVRAHALTDRVHLLCCHLLQASCARFALIAANLPYVATRDLAGTSADVARFEPRLALDGGESGLTLVRDLLCQARSRLSPDGTLLAEIGSMQGTEAAALAAAQFGAARVSVIADLFGNARVLRVGGPR
ncbi:MAG: peptide chain release factor N(5)-glutamine methyltransferase [Anaerolineae bacterium]